MPREPERNLLAFILTASFVQALSLIGPTGGSRIAFWLVSSGVETPAVMPSQPRSVTTPATREFADRNTGGPERALKANSDRLSRGPQSREAEVADQHIDRHREYERCEHRVQCTFTRGERVGRAGAEEPAENSA